MASGVLWTAEALDGVTQPKEKEGDVEGKGKGCEEWRWWWWWRRESREENEAERGWISAGPLSRRVPLHVCTTNAYALLLRTMLRCRDGPRSCKFDEGTTVFPVNKPFRSTVHFITVALCERKYFSRVSRKITL